MLKSPLSARPVIEALEARIAPATFTVTTTADSGPGSLRQAILDANALEGADTIGFDIPGDQLQVIALTSALPIIKEQLTISTVTLFEAPQLTELVRIDGTSAGPGVNGLNIEASKCVIAGVQIANFSDSGIFLNGSTNATIVRSAIFGMGNHGIHILGGGYNFVFSNQIGLHSSIPNSIGNQGDGILIENSSGNSIAPPQYFNSVGINVPPWIVSGNSIIANGLFGIEIRGGESNAVAGNEIAKNGAHAVALDKGGGIGIFDSKSASIGKVIEYFDVSYRIYRSQVVGNSVSENIGHGVLIRGAQSSAQIAGNGISNNTPGDGVHIDGATNTYFGIVNYEKLSEHNLGHTMVGNTVTNNGGWGIAVVNGASNIAIQGTKVANNSAGAILLDHASGAKIGGLNTYYYYVPYGTGASTTTDDNNVQFGEGVGISVKDSSGVQVIGNSFTGTGIPIDLAGDGLTVNDSGDVDTGANHLQNYPVLTLASNQVSAALATDAVNTQFRIQLYRLDPASGYSLLNTQEVTTGADGRALSTFNSVSLNSGQKLFATATNLVTGETSEMSVEAGIWPRISINPASVTEGSTGVQNASFTVSLESATTVPVKVGYRSSDNTAKAGEDYGAVEGVLVFEPGETTKTITVPVFGDPIKEATESFFIQLANVENGVLTPTNSSVVGTIINDDGLPTISIQDVVMAEGANASITRPGYTEVQYTVTLSESSLDPVTVKLGVVGGTASVSSDYDPIDSTITFAPGATSVTKTLYIKNDTAREETETIQLQLSNPTAGNLGNATAIVSILDDDTWQIQADAVQIVEGNDGQSVAVMEVRLVNSYGVTDHTHPISVDFNTQNGTATAGSDYIATNGTLTFQPGEIEKMISVPILGDNTAEQNENFSVKFSTPFGATLQQASQTVSLLNDDPGTVSVASASITEGHGGQKILVFNVSMSVPTTSPVSVNFETQDGTALAGVDFEALTGMITFAPGETQKTISVAILGDRIAEQNEAFTLKLTGATGATITTATATGTILNDDPFISIESAQFLEGQPSIPGTHSVYLPVRLSQATDIPISVDFTTSNGSAEASSDYIATSGTLTFAAGQTLQYIELQIVGDLTFEPDETFSVKLSNPQGAEIGAETGVVIIKSDEPFISAQDVTIAEGHSGTKSLVFSVTLSQVQNSVVTVDYTTADGTATAGSDYTAVSGTLSFAPGETMKTVSVPISGDTVQEADETLWLLLSNAVGVSVGKTGVLGTIANDDSLESLPVLSVLGTSITEGYSTQALTFILSLSQTSTSAVSVQYSTVNGTATAGSDYTPVSGSLTFAPGEMTKTISVPIIGDTVQEANETLRLLLSSVTGATLGVPEATGFILNDDSQEPLPILSVASAHMLETDSGIAPLQFKFSLSKASTSAVSVQYSTANGTAIAGTIDGGGDYAPASGTVTFAPGETTKIVSVTYFGDKQVEDNETVQLLLSGVAGATLGVDQATGFILNDDDVQTELSVANASVIEGHSGSNSLVFTFSLSKASTTPVSVHYSTANGTATAGSDYTAASGTLTFAPGETTKTVSVTISGDQQVEADETLRLLLTNVSGASLATTEAQGVIANDDAPESLPVLSVASASVTEGHFGSNSLVFTFSLSKASASAVSVHYSTADGTATAGSDYTAASGTLTFAPGETTKAVSVTISGDQQIETNETLRLLLSNVSGASLATAEAQGVIANDDAPESLPVLFVANPSVIEGNFGASTLVFTLGLTKASASAVSLQYSTADGTATVGSDYTATFGTLTFAPGETTKTVSVTISGDQQVEANETLQLLLSGVNGAVLGTTEATGFILNDDSTTPQALPTLSVQGGSVYEGYTGTKPLIFTVTLSEASAWPVSVSYSASSGTAYGSFLDPYADFLAASGSLTFAPGEMSKTVEVLIYGDEFREANETVLFSLSFPTGATLATTQTTGTILNDDLYGEDVGLIISKIGKGKHKAVWSENDGDLVTLISSQQISWLSFGFDAEGHTVVQKVSTIGDKPSSLQFTVQKSLTGDGKVNVDQIWTNADLTEVSIPGRLGSIIAGDTKLKTPAIHKLTVDSFGLDPASVEAGAEPLQSKIRGSIGSFTVKGDFTGANLSVSGGSFGSLTIGGNLLGTSASTATGLYVEKGLNKLQVDGDIRGTDPAHPVIIRTAGFPDHPTETLHRTVIGGDVTNTNLLAGTESQVGIRVGDILVNGDWTASNLIVGAGAGPDGLPGTDDDIATQDTASRIARITIRGAISGTAETESGTDHFGFVAGRIAAFQVGAQKLALSSKWKDSMEVGSTFDVMLCELAGRSRA